MDAHLHSRLALDRKKILFFIIYLSIVTLFSFYLLFNHGHFGSLLYFSVYSPMVHCFKGGGCKDTSHILFSTFIYSYLFSSFSPFTAIIPGCTLLFKQLTEVLSSLA